MNSDPEAASGDPARSCPGCILLVPISPETGADLVRGQGSRRSEGRHSLPGGGPRAQDSADSLSLRRMVRSAGTSLPVRTQEAPPQAPVLGAGGPSAMRAQRCPSSGQGHRFQAVSQVAGAWLPGLRGPGPRPPRLSASWFTFRASAELWTPAPLRPGKLWKELLNPAGREPPPRTGAGRILCCPPAASTPPRKGAGGTLKATLLTQERRPIFSSSHLASL